jgi:molybdopterin molybdotransferase
MISVDEAQARLLALASPLPPIEVELSRAGQHYMRGPLVAMRTQPAADLSAMDGYAVISADFPGPWRVIGESAAGRPFSGMLHSGEAVRIFTGAHVPKNADRILIQENAAREGDIVHATQDQSPADKPHIQHAGSDFLAGAEILKQGALLGAGQIALAAMAGYGTLCVGGRPRVAVVATGDELVAAGSQCTAAQIPSSNSPMLRAMLSNMPCDVIDGGILPDDLAALEASLARLAAQADVIVTTGGASVGDHDLVQPALLNIGAKMDFWKVAMRPGKPLMAGKIGDTIMLGLPGNPSSAYVTATLFLLPLLRYMSGCQTPFPELQEAITTRDLPAGGIRAEYLRARMDGGRITPLNTQDSGLTHSLSHANALLLQPVNGPSRAAGNIVQYIRLS